VDIQLWDWLAPIGIIGGLWTGNVVSLYSLAVYIDPDEVEEVFPDLKPARRKFLSRLAEDPRAFTRMATIYKSFVLILVTMAIWPLVNLILYLTGFPDVAVWVPGLVLIWLAYLLFVEFLPRRHSRRAIGVGFARHLWVIIAVDFFLSPITRLYKRVVGKNRRTGEVSEEDKEEIIERAIETLAEDAGIGESLVEDDEKAMIGQIFLLDQTVVREIMIPRIDITGIGKNLTFMQIREIVLESGYSRYPVYEEKIDNVIGLIYVKDLFNNMPEPGEVFDISKYLRRPYFVPETKIIGELLTEFKIRRQHIAIAVDEYGGVAGLVTLEDIIEEIFGEIQDEHDTKSEEFEKVSEGVYHVSAALSVEKLQQHLDTDYDEEDYDTVGGLIYGMVGSVPTEGQRIKWHDIEFEVARVDGQRIRSVIVRFRSPGI